MTTTTRPVQADLGCVRRAISGTAARTTNATSNAKIEPSSFMAVAHPPSPEACDGGCATAMKLLGSILALLVALVVLAAVPLIARRTQPRSACTGRVVVVIGRHGEPVECTCVHGRLSTCFDPGA